MITKTGVKILEGIAKSSSCLKSEKCSANAESCRTAGTFRKDAHCTIANGWTLKNRNQEWKGHHLSEVFTYWRWYSVILCYCSRRRQPIASEKVSKTLVFQILKNEGLVLTSENSSKQLIFTLLGGSEGVDLILSADGRRLLASLSQVPQIRLSSSAWGNHTENCQKELWGFVDYDERDQVRTFTLP